MIIVAYFSSMDLPMGTEDGSRVAKAQLDRLHKRVRATEHAPRDTFRVLRSPGPTFRSTLQVIYLQQLRTPREPHENSENRPRP